MIFEYNWIIEMIFWFLLFISIIELFTLNQDIWDNKKSRPSNVMLEQMCDNFWLLIQDTYFLM